MSKIPIEDNFDDILNKAQVGLSLRNQMLAREAGISQDSLTDLKRGIFNEITARQVASVLQLNPRKFIETGKQAWYPRPLRLKGLHLFNSPYPIPGYEAMSVNAYVIEIPGQKSTIVFDCGPKAEPILDFLRENDLKVEAVFITHTHPDHVEDLPRLLTETGKPPCYVSRREPWRNAELIRDGKTFEFEGLKVAARLTAGHSPGGTSYVVTGLRAPVAVVGDALFAGSVGGAPTSWEDQLEMIREKILILPQNTVICPGHGPMTTVREEKAHNSLFPEF